MTACKYNPCTRSSSSNTIICDVPADAGGAETAGHHLPRPEQDRKPQHTHHNPYNRTRNSSSNTTIIDVPADAGGGGSAPCPHTGASEGGRGRGSGVEKNGHCLLSYVKGEARLTYHPLKV